MSNWTDKLDAFFMRFYLINRWVMYIGFLLAIAAFAYEKLRVQLSFPDYDTFLILFVCFTVACLALFLKLVLEVVFDYDVNYIHEMQAALKAKKEESKEKE